MRMGSRGGSVLRRVISAVLGATLVLAVTTGPAYAEDDGYEEFVDIVLSIFEKGADGRYTPEEVRQLLAELNGAINGVKVDLLARLDNGLVNDIKGDTEYVVKGTAFLTMGPSFAGPYVNNTLAAATHAKNHIGTVRHDDEALDAVGRAMVTIFTTLDAAYVAVGHPREAENMLPTFREGLEQLVAEMDPHCEGANQPNIDFETFECRYGDTTIRAVRLGPTYEVRGAQLPVTQLPAPIDRELIVNLTMAGTIKTQAMAINEQLKARGVPLPPPTN